MGGNSTIAYPGWWWTSNAIRIAVIAIYAIVGLSAILFNLFVIYAVMNRRSMRKNINLFIGNMAFSDMMIAVWNISFELVNITTRSWHWRVEGTGGRILCKLYYFSGSMGYLVSPLTLLFITVERFRGVKSLAAKGVTRKGLLCYVALTWLIPALLYSPFLYFMDLMNYPDGTLMCERIIPTTYYKVYITPLYGVFVVLYFAIAALGFMILWRLRDMETFVNLPEVQRRARKLRVRNAVRMVLCSLGTFILLTTPYHAQIFVFFFLGGDLQLYFKVYYGMLFLVCLNCAVSPCIYYVFIEDFRQAMRRVWSIERRTTTATQMQTRNAETVML
ncbi:predicted protein [Nematostella vectensis]|uniref:G-protein coupled receptors family 1 profile domain-containing protein n=1 Tax=Nematostella vectensis TaxID=45351 RepID=A7SLG5_NEMVE|nr:neuropeptide Y receptor type 5 [Nematostella vectensis]XP_032231224.1 neuropeptide Y receptor type 5 [Nematostella vectensis]XP_032231225.1 neuropeptide Y receptor type 5 [Nematostella vectensis]XP_032231226.1 neuropeptide Y receptor type 5 [Nematostella vectensis]XP_032231227.1 neuropeptide Y receptor type 5 [Nematostella vectensis]XP_048576556.1 neuropeptide Y receptor type 5 [Nematostella vectensis]EDO35434.1 predicted protein [Nematostella vectensis]|eukprot:XP_001627534.1 predicted protein [Nematostella vectensis]